MSIPSSKTADLQKIRDLIGVTPDTRRYFYARADEKWFDWLWDNGFFEVVKETPEDPTNLRYRTPELDYIVKVAEKIPTRVVDFILSFNVRNTSNLETLDRFLWLSTKLPAEEIARLVQKIRDECWLQTISGFHHWTFGYKEMLDKLKAAGDFKSMLILAESLIAVRSKGDVDMSAFGSARNPFYLGDIHYSEVFERINEIEDTLLEEAVIIVLRAFGEVLSLSGKDEGDEVFAISEIFPLFDVDFFTLEMTERPRYSSRDDVKDLAATAKNLIQRIFAGADSDTVRVLYEKYIATLPDARDVWRFKLYAWTLEPEVFDKELRDGFFRLFEHQNPWPIAGGAEYEQALKRGFGQLSEGDKRAYIDGVFERFGTEERPTYGYGILSSIYTYLSDEDREKAKKIYGSALQDEYEPHTSIGPTMAGTVVPQTPEGAEEGFTKTIPEIVELLKTKWTPEELYKNHKREDFLRPINAEGVASRLEAKTKERLVEYVESAELFFDRGLLDANYTYAYLRGVRDAVRADLKGAGLIDWGPIVALGKAIVASANETPFETKGRDREQFDSWLSSWRDVHSALADLLHDLFRDVDDKPIVDFARHRGDLFEITNYLLSFRSPEPADEQLETAMSKVKAPGEDEYVVSDPHVTAINTARGRAFEAFLQFVYQDSKKFPKESKERLSEDVKAAYTELLAQEDTRAIMFMFGHYLFFFYYRHPEWIKNLMPQIFSEDVSKADLYLAAWEGYLTSALYAEVFEEMHDQYMRAISIDSSSYPKRSYRTNLDEALATQIALAYLHYEDFTFTTPLYKAFWEKENEKRHHDFVSFIGRSVISRDNPAGWLAEHPEVKPEKMLAFWDWALENISNPEVFDAFGFWINTNIDIFDPTELVKRVRATLEKSKGKMSWEYGLMKALPIFAEVSPRDAVEILRLYFTEMDTSVQARGFMHIDANLIEVFKKLYRNPATKGLTDKLITDLLPIGNGAYWSLKTAREE